MGDELYYIERKVMLVKCAYCEKEFNKTPSQIKKTGGKNYCSRNCSAKINNKKYPKRKKIRVCDSCDKKVSYCNKFCKSCLHLQSFKQKTKGQVCVNSKKEGSTHIRQHARAVAKVNKILNKPCAKCNYSYHTQICHIKSIKSFPNSSLISEINDVSNLVQLCPNCHWEFDHNIGDG